MAEVKPRLEPETKSVREGEFQRSFNSLTSPSEKPPVPPSEGLEVSIPIWDPPSPDRASNDSEG